MASKMTPGRWNTGDGGFLSQLNIFNEEGYQVARAQQFVSGYLGSQASLNDESLANAKAIAAVPELIEALQSIINTWFGQGRDYLTVAQFDAATNALGKAGVL